MSSRGLRLVWPLLLLLLAAAPGRGVAADAFAVRGIDVDITAKTVAAAKDQAFAEAEQKGFRRLLERLTMPADYARLPSADPVQYVRDVAIEQERASAVRYIATITVRYHPAAVKKLLQGAGIKYADPRPRPVVIVPVFRPLGGGRAMLWEDGNPWKAMWNGLGGGGLVALALPSADLPEAQAVTPEKAMAGDAEALGGLAARYRTSDVLVMTAMVNGASNALDVAVTAMPGAPKPFETRSYPVGELGLDGALRQAAVDASQVIDNAYKQQNLLSFDQAATLAAMAPLTSLDDWLAVRDRLGRVPLVRRWEIISLSRSEAALMLYTLGPPEQVKSALDRAGLVMDWADGYWAMHLKGAP